MTTDLLAWDEDDQTPDPEAEYRMLLNGLRRTEGFGLFFVQCSPFRGETLIQQIRQDLSDERIEVLKLEEPLADGNVFKCLKGFIDAQIGTQVLFVEGLEQSLLDYEESKKRLGWSSAKIFSYSWHGIPPALINLNQQRERFRDSFATRIVFLLPIFAMKYLVHRAPDFFDWRSGVAQLQDDASTLTRESHRIQLESSYSEYLDWSQKKRNSRILEIQSLLEAKKLNESVKTFLYFEQGNLFIASKEYETAIAAYDSALTIKPDSYEILYNKSFALYELGWYEQAIIAYDAVLAIKSDDFEALCNKGKALGNLGRYEAAIYAYDAALEINPTNHEVLYSKSESLMNLGRHDSANAIYEAALNLSSRDVTCSTTKVLRWMT